MRTPTTLSAILLTAALAAAQTAGKPAAQYHLDDPANLAGERVSAPALADTLPINHGAAALQQLLLKLRTRASIMLIVAHPDDEDGGMLTYESRGQGARVAMLTLNRGEGGQNLMTGDFNDALGLIRTQELLAADRYMGVDQFFGSVVDFGFSKAREEALEQWGHDRVLYDAVRCVRLYRPLIVASVFVGGPTDGHGQHQVAGQMAQEVFNAAADPKVFPEMGLPPWAPMKVYARARGASNDPRGIYDVTTGQYAPARYMNYVTGIAAAVPPAPAVIVHEGEVSTALGMNGDTYSQFARKGLALQKSQNGGGGGGRGGGGGGPVDAAYARYGSRVPNSPATENSFFDGIDTSLAGIADLAPDAPKSLRGVLQLIDMKVAEAQKAFDPNNLGVTAEPLRAALKTLDTVIEGTEKSTLNPTEKWNLLHELRIKRVQANNALVLALGVSLRAALTEPAAGQPLLSTQKSLAAKVEIATVSAKPLQLSEIRLAAGNLGRSVLQEGSSLDAANPKTIKVNLDLPTGLPPTRPYFGRPDVEQPYYNISNPNLRNAPSTPAPVTASATVLDEGTQLVLFATVAGGLETKTQQAVDVVPELSVSVAPNVGIAYPDRENGTFHFTGSVRTNLQNVRGNVSFHYPTGWEVTPAEDALNLPSVGSEQRFSVKLTSKVQASAAKTVEREVTVIATDDQPTGPSGNLLALKDGRSPAYSDGYRAVGYPGLVSTNYYTPASYKAVPVDLHTAPNLKVAYLPGTGDDVPAYLPDIGITPTILAPSDLTAEKLAPYDAVVLGIRAYSAHPELAGAGSKPLLEYAKNGGVVIVQYNNGRYGAEDAPYPITTPLASQDHAHDVVVEAQPVAVLAPDAPVLNWPNKITSADFDHWVEERGHGFAGTWAPEYQALLETHDPGQDPQKGGLLVARTGKGYYIYCGLALYRQLPEGVPGAYRLLANLLSIGKNPAAK